MEKLLQSEKPFVDKSRITKVLEGFTAEIELWEAQIRDVKANPSKFPSDALQTAEKELEEITKRKQIYKGLLFHEDQNNNNSNSESAQMSSSGGTQKRVLQMTQAPVYYADYLSLDTVLNSQHLESAKHGNPAHDEMLFIIIHQTYELWFKQILHEINAVLTVMNRQYVPERDMSRVLHHMVRVIEIMKVLVEQLNILETMTSLDFMDFRDYLVPASGFQSFQFRLLENTLGLKPDSRVQYERQAYHTKLSAKHQVLVQTSEGGVTLFDVVERWLERTPFLSATNFDFLKNYIRAAEEMFEEDKQLRLTMAAEQRKQGPIPQSDVDKELAQLEANQASFRALFDENEHNERIKAGHKRLSFKATQAALLIYIYQEEPIFHIPFRFLQCLIDMDEYLTSWRYKHSMMVQRMIGTKMGTGGSSGYWYLRATIERGKVFGDIGNLATYLLPRKDLPPLPQEMKRALGFIVEQQRQGGYQADSDSSGPHYS